MTAITWVRDRLSEAKAALPRRAPVAADPPEVTVPLSLVRSAKLAAWMAYFALVYFLLLYTFDIARDRAGTAHFTHVGFWTGDVRVYAPYLVGFFIVAIGIPYVAKISIPTFMSLDWRMNFWPKLWALFIAAAVSLVVIAGTFTVQGDTLLERDRESAVAVAQVEQSNAVLQAQIAAKEAELRSMMENRNAYLAQAASVGEAEWQRSYIDQTSATDPQRDRIVRALGAARAADAVRATLGELRSQAATATTTSAVASRVTTENTSWIASTLGWLEGARAILLSLVMDIVCLIMPWIALRLEQTRNRQMAFAEPREFDAAHAIEDMRDQPKQKPEPAYELQTKMYDEDGNELVKRRATFARKPTKGKKAQATFEGVSLPDEAGVQYANDARVAMAAAGVVMAPSIVAGAPPLAAEEQPAEEHPEHEVGGAERGDESAFGIDHEPITTTLSPEAIAALNADFGEEEAPASTLLGVDGTDGVMVDEEPEQYGPPATVRQLEVENA